MRAVMTGQLALFNAPAAAAAIALDPRPYQDEAQAAVWAAYERGVTRQMIAMPTASGKTVVFCFLIRRWGGRAVVIVHRDELVQQTLAKIRTITPHLSAGVVKAERDELHAPVVVASAQTLAHERRLERLVSATSGGGLLVIADEAHHSVAASWRRALERLRPSLLVGVSATPMRGDGVGLGAVYEEIVYSANLLDLMHLGFLAPLTGLRIDSTVDLDAVHTVAGEFNQGELEEAVNTPARNRLIVEAWQRHAAGRTRTVAFCVDVAHARDLAGAFRAAGTEADVILGTTPPDERRRLLTAFHEGRLPVLCNVMVLTEGYDEPGIDCLLMARPTKSQGLYIQMAGRGARLSRDTGKTDCLVVDFMDLSSRHKLISFPSLAGTDALRAADEATADTRADGEQVSLLDHAARQTRLREVAAVAVNLYEQSAYVWQGWEQARGRPVLRMAPAGRNTWIVMEQDSDGYRPLLLQSPGYGAPTMLTPLAEGALPDLGYAMAIAEQAATPFADEAGFRVQRGGWRDRADPPTERQIEAARRVGLDATLYRTKGALSQALDRQYFKSAYRRAKRRYDTQ